LKKVLVTLLGLFGPPQSFGAHAVFQRPQSDSALVELRPPFPLAMPLLIEP